MSTPGISAPWRPIKPVCLHQLSCPNLALSRSHIYIHVHPITHTRWLQENGLSKCLCSWSCWGLTYVVFVIDDRVEGHVFAPQVSLSRLHVVGAVVALNEALKLTIHNGAMSQGTFLTWEFKLQRYRCQRIHIRFMFQKTGNNCLKNALNCMAAVIH